MFLITYDLNNPDQKYNSLYKVIQSATDHFQILDSTWLIITLLTTEQWYEKIKSIVDDNDNFFVTDVTNQPRSGWLSIPALEWINKNQV